MPEQSQKTFDSFFLVYWVRMHDIYQYHELLPLWQVSGDSYSNLISDHGASIRSSNFWCLLVLILYYQGM